MDSLKTLLAIHEAKSLIEAEHGEYEDSGEFTDELDTVADHVKAIKKIITTYRWKNWMRVTDKNFGGTSIGGQCARENQKMNEHFKKFEDSFLKLATMLEEAGE